MHERSKRILRSLVIIVHCTVPTSKLSNNLDLYKKTFQAAIFPIPENRPTVSQSMKCQQVYSGVPV